MKSRNQNRPMNIRRRRLLRALAVAPAVGAVACGKSGGGSEESSPVATRTWKLGFSPVPARPTATSVLQGIDRWSQRAELAIIHEQLPWTDLLSGMSPDAILDRDKVDLVNYMRGKGMKLVFMGDLDDGLARDMEAPQLRALGRSITEPAVQQAYRDYMLAVVNKLQPEYVGLAAETNLIRTVAPAALYNAVVTTANDTANAIRAAGSTVPLAISVQVETAWGVLAGAGSGAYVGVDQDFTDFPFADILGLSSYPYFGYTEPEDIPDNYYSRLLQGHTLPAMVMEGGWASTNAAPLFSSPEKQARYVRRHADLLDSIDAIAYLQLVFADIDLAVYPPPIPPNLPLFVSIGLTDSDFNGKPALDAWDVLFARVLV
jgi:hypothetical protein